MLGGGVRSTIAINVETLRNFILQLTKRPYEGLLAGNLLVILFRELEILKQVERRTANGWRDEMKKLQDLKKDKVPI